MTAHVRFFGRLPNPDDSAATGAALTGRCALALSSHVRAVDDDDGDESAEIGRRGAKHGADTGMFRLWRGLGPVLRSNCWPQD